MARAARMLVNLPQVLQRPDEVMIGRVPFWLRGGGLNLTGDVPGRLLAQIRSSNGGWFAVVLFRIPSRDNQGYLEVPHLCPTRGMRKLEP